MREFEDSTENAKSHGQNIRYGSDVFAQVVLTLEDIARMTERGIYELQTWICGLKSLPAATSMPACFAVLQFDSLPTEAEIRERYRQLSKSSHPDSGGTVDMFQKLTDATNEALAYVKGGEGE